MSDAFDTWAGRMKALGASIVPMPEQAGPAFQTLSVGGLKKIGKPAARFSGVRIAELNTTRSAIGEPDFWSAKKQWGFFLAPSAAVKAEAADADRQREVTSPSIADSLGALADRVKSVGTVGYWVVIGVVILLGVVVVFYAAKKAKAVTA